MTRSGISPLFDRVFLQVSAEPCYTPSLCLWTYLARGLVNAFTSCFVKRKRGCCAAASYLAVITGTSSLFANLPNYCSSKRTCPRTQLRLPKLCPGYAELRTQPQRAAFHIMGRILFSSLSSATREAGQKKANAFASSYTHLPFRCRPELPESELRGKWKES